MLEVADREHPQARSATVEADAARGAPDPAGNTGNGGGGGYAGAPSFLFGDAGGASALDVAGAAGASTPDEAGAAEALTSCR
ncbi:MAG: hypothetical protein ABI548_03485 [Polyangiaceae bacterium]